MLIRLHGLTQSLIGMAAGGFRPLLEMVVYGEDGGESNDTGNTGWRCL